MIVGLLMTISCSHFELCFLLINLITSELVMQLWPRYELAQSIFKDRFCTSKEGGIGEVGGHIHGMLCMAAVLVRKTLVGTGWAICLLFGTNGCRNQSSAFSQAPFLVL